MSLSPYICRIREHVGTDLLLLPASAVLPRDDEGRVLLVRQADYGQWATIGGSVEVDEAPDVCAVREAAEEAGVDIEITKLLTAVGGPQFRVTYPNGDEVSYVSVVYEARVVGGRPRPDNDETIDVGWFSPSELATLDLTPFTRHVLARLGLLADEAKRRLRLAYDTRAAERDAMDDAAWKRAERERFLELMRSCKVRRLLEIGAGHGVSGRYFADQGIDVTCTDLSPELVARCRVKGLTAHVMDFGNLEFADASFDAVFSMNCLLHVPRNELKGVLESVRAVLPDGGLFYWGQYSSEEPFAGTFADDKYEPKRFFSLLTTEEIQAAAADVFTAMDYRFVALDGIRAGYHALVLTR